MGARIDNEAAGRAKAERIGALFERLVAKHCRRVAFDVPVVKERG